MTSHRHAPGWAWRESAAGRVDRPWAWNNINGSADLPSHVGGLCENEWHDDCPQAPLQVLVPGCCSCACHQTVGPRMTPA
ncbi:MAG: hypothetical protein L0H78_25905, partial [Humibacillus sp.]|nr:hypothetical protein [Humibacillus sp.]